MLCLLEKWIELKIIVLNQSSQILKEKHCMGSLGGS